MAASAIGSSTGQRYQVIDRNRHAATGRFRAPRLREQSPRPCPRSMAAARGGLSATSTKSIMPTAAAIAFAGSISTCLAATVGTLAIGIVLYGSLNPNLENDSVLDQLSNVQQPTPTPLRLSVLDDGLNWAIPKSNRLLPCEQRAHRPLHHPRAGPGSPQQSSVHPDPAIPAHLDAAGAGLAHEPGRHSAVQSLQPLCHSSASR